MDCYGNRGETKPGLNRLPQRLQQAVDIGVGIVDMRGNANGVAANAYIDLPIGKRGRHLLRQAIRVVDAEHMGRAIRVIRNHKAEGAGLFRNAVRVCLQCFGNPFHPPSRGSARERRRRWGRA